MSAKKNPSTFQFETAMDELNQIVMQMEKGDVPLEDALASFEKGMGLIQQCQQVLAQAQQKVEILTKNHGGPTLQPFLPDE